MQTQTPIHQLHLSYYWIDGIQGTKKVYSEQQLTTAATAPPCTSGVRGACASL